MRWFPPRPCGLKVLILEARGEGAPGQHTATRLKERKRERTCESPLSSPDGSGIVAVVVAFGRESGHSHETQSYTTMTGEPTKDPYQSRTTVGPGHSPKKM